MRYAVAILGVIAVVVIATFLLFGRQPDTEQPRQDIMVEYSNLPAEVIHTTRGPIVGDEDFRTIRIYVNRVERGIEILHGYDDRVEVRQTYNNNEAAYSTFMLALDQAGFGHERSTAIEDERGVCPLGRRFIYELMDGADAVIRTWGTSCSRRQGSFNGDANQVRRLFEQQIPDFRDITRDVRLRV
jgi:hypothetical protein